ncbi:hypothetical protein ICM05_05450 [Leucobacter sp. cx-42]|uniref:hypothetical protein n=1 Tax=unclassified Leucobacter TaxID=2621730 RepID=UPI00165E0335|nr:MULTISPECIES: hypothetical protein [unclassified Leucobacter]MBC9954091.1 hypothetical protein [Leucobacter sp. cx-42]
MNSVPSAAVSSQEDPQMQLPTFPAICPGLPTTCVDNTLVVDGLLSRRSISGEIIRSLGSKVFSVLDGATHIAELPKLLNLSAASCHEFLFQLFTAGLLLDGELGEWESDPLLSFLHRATDQTRKNSSGTIGLSNLTNAKIAILSQDPTLKATLENRLVSGYGVSIVHNWVAVTRVDLLVMLLTNSSAKDSNWNDAIRDAHEQGIPILPVHFGNSEALIGPSSSFDYGPCPMCGGHTWDYSFPSEKYQPLLLGLVEQQISLLVAGVGAAQSENNGIHIHGSPFKTDAVVAVPEPGCTICQVAPSTASNPIWSYIFESSVAIPPARARRPRGHQKHYEPSNALLQVEQRTPVHGSPEVLLPHHLIRDVHLFKGLNVDSLAILLEYSFGINRTRSSAENAIRRWAPSGGNLGSPQAYLRVAGFQDLPNGRYFYNALNHSLVPIMDTNSCGSTELEILISGEISRTWKKYGNFGYRIVHFDTGIAISHLTTIASAFGLAVKNAQAWEDQHLADEYALDRNSQVVTAQMDFREDPKE